MDALTRLLRVGSLAESIGVYLPVKMLQKGVGLIRLLLFMYLMTRSEYGLWGLGMLIFMVAGPVLTLGSHHGLTRYAGLYEARGHLRAFCRRMQWAVPAVTVAMTAAALAGSGLITDLVIVSRRQAETIPYAHQRMVCWAALANALVMALYYNMLGLMYGLRTYRLAAAVELLFGVVFTGLGIAALLVSPTGLAALLAHLAALVVSLAAGMVAIHVGLGRLAEAAPRPRPRVQEQPAGEPSAAPGEAGAPLSMDGAFRRVLRFGLVALLGATLWNWAIYLSFWLTSKVCGTALGGVYHALLSLGQPVLFAAEAIWAVLFTHVAKRWESGQRATALRTLETAYKAVALAMMTLTIAVIAAAPMKSFGGTSIGSPLSRALYRGCRIEPVPRLRRDRLPRRRADLGSGAPRALPRRTAVAARPDDVLPGGDPSGLDDDPGEAARATGGHRGGGALHSRTARAGRPWWRCRSPCCCVRP